MSRGKKPAVDFGKRDVAWDVIKLCNAACMSSCEDARCITVLKIAKHLISNRSSEKMRGNTLYVVPLCR
jgi:hypothetical protein